MKINKSIVFFFALFLVLLTMFMLYYYKYKKTKYISKTVYLLNNVYMPNMHTIYGSIVYYKNEVGRYPEDNEDYINIIINDTDRYYDYDKSDVYEFMDNMNIECKYINTEKIYFLRLHNQLKDFGYNFEISIAWDEDGNLKKEYSGYVPKLVNNNLILVPIIEELELEELQRGIRSDQQESEEDLKGYDSSMEQEP